MRSPKILTTLLILGILTNLSTAQTLGRLSGIVSDVETGEPLIGANVFLGGTTVGAATDLEGRFSLQATPGIYTINATYIGYEIIAVENVSIIAGTTQTLNLRLKSESLKGEEVEVIAEQRRGDNISLLAERMDSNNMKESIGSEQMSRTGDSNAGEALTRMTGVTIREGKFPIVRGLGERYTSTQLNNAPVPSPEPDRKAIPLDLFPSALLESVTVLKTFTPDQPGVFAGGSINIRTKAYPDNRVVNLNFGAGDNTSLYSGESFRSTRTGKHPFWGYDGGQRDVPSAVLDSLVLTKSASARPDWLTSSKDWFNYLGNAGRAFDTQFFHETGQAGRPVSIGMNLGNQFNPTRRLQWGYFTNLAFGSGYGFRDMETNQWARSGNDTNISYLAFSHRENQRSTYKTSLGGNASTGLTINNRQKFKLQHFYTHTSSDQVTYSTGYTPNVDNGIFIRQHYIEKTINATTLSGHNPLPGLDHVVEWSASRGNSLRYEPDTKSHNYSVQERYAGTDSAYTIYGIASEGSTLIGRREFTDGEDNNTSGDFNYQLNLGKAGPDQFKFKVGTRIQSKDRQFEKRSLAVELSTSGAATNDLKYQDSDAPLGVIFSEENYFYVDSAGTMHHGLMLIDEASRNAFNGYSATEDISAYYFMMDIPVSLGLFRDRFMTRFVGGMRVEDYNMELHTYNSVTGAPATTVNGDTANAHLKEQTLFPSANLIFTLTATSKLRLAFSETVGRPEFRELAPLAYQEFYNGEVTIGFPFLKTASVQNYDIRWEWYPSPAELISIGLFSKDFSNPIEVANIATPDLVYKTYQNALSANTWGAEMELRKNIPFIPLSVGFATLISNASISQSTVEVDTLVTLYNGTTYGNAISSTRRPLQGQSRFMFNLGLNVTLTNGYDFSLAYNTFSRRIASVGTGVLGDEFEFPFNSLNITASRKLGAFKLSFKAKNLLNSTMKFGLVDETNDEILIKTAYKPGLSFNLGLSWQP